MHIIRNCLRQTFESMLVIQNILFIKDNKNEEIS